LQKAEWHQVLILGAIQSKGNLNLQNNDADLLRACPASPWGLDKTRQ
jgi:hypothetical protein